MTNTPLPVKYGVLIASASGEAGALVWMFLQRVL